MRTTYYAFKYSWQKTDDAIQLSTVPLTCVDASQIPMGTIIIDTTELECSEEVFNRRIDERKLKCAEVKVVEARRALQQAEDHLASLLALPSK